MMDRDLAQIVSDNEQDRVNMLKWWKENSLAVKMAVWKVIQIDNANPVEEIVTRFAQVAFAEMLEKELRGEL